MFKGLANIAELMKQAGEMKARMGEMKQRLAELQMTGTAGNGAVTVVATGDQRLVSCQIAPEVAGDAVRLEALILEAANQALSRARQEAAQQLASVVGKPDIPGFPDALSNLGLGN
jgi:DNA-binding YbaB/EbfC family protein